MLNTIRSVYVTSILTFILVFFSSIIDAKSLDENEVQRGIDLWKVPALAVSVVTDKNIEFKKGFGKTAYGQGSPVDQHTLFGIMSTTKAMVAAGILILADQDKLKLDDLVIKYIPELHFKDSSLTQQITIRDLLAHRTGMPSTDFLPFVQKAPLALQIQKLSTVDPSAPVRSRFIYQNTMYELVGEIIKRVSGKRWDRFLKQVLWQPIGMNETYGTRGQISPNQQYVLPYILVDKKVHKTGWDFDDDEANAAGSVWSSIHDMSLWAQFLLNEGRNASGEQVISSASLSEMFKPQMMVAHKDFYPTTELTHPNWTTYGLGWFQQDFQGRKIDFHTGSLSGLIAIIGLDIANKKAMVVLGNQDHAELRHALLWHVMDEQTGDFPTDWNQSMFDLYQKQIIDSENQQLKQMKSRVSEKKHSLPLEQYVGTYVHKSFGELEVSFENKQLKLKSKRLTLNLSHWHFDTFEMTSDIFNTRNLMNFNLSQSAQVQSLHFYGLDFIKKE
ncbi:MAG: CubicO group peptidase (beta-lactamase class C family) [Paraglaciecola sp.]|jgi:CubicO group peptidase (beta-lactamase class C family)